MKWTKKQWDAWSALVDWSHRAGHEGAKKLLSNAGMPQETLPCHVVFNIQDDIAYAIRRGAIRLLNELTYPGEDSGDF